MGCSPPLWVHAVPIIFLMISWVPAIVEAAATVGAALQRFREDNSLKFKGSSTGLCGSAVVVNSIWFSGGAEWG